MDKSLKVGEDEWRERERGGHEFYASNEVRTLKSHLPLRLVQNIIGLGFSQFNEISFPTHTSNNELI